MQPPSTAWGARVEGWARRRLRQNCMNLTHGMGMGMGYVAVDNTATLGLLCYMLLMVACVKWCKAWQARGAVLAGSWPCIRAYTLVQFDERVGCCRFTAVDNYIWHIPLYGAYLRFPLGGPCLFHKATLSTCNYLSLSLSIIEYGSSWPTKTAATTKCMGTPAWHAVS